MFANDPTRLRLLVQTRCIVLNNLPFVFGEYDDTMIISQMFVEEKFHASMNRKNVTQAIIEMYTTTKLEFASHIKKSILGGAQSLTLVADFWTCLTQSASYLGVRLYFVDYSWKLRSALLGVRRFTPDYGERGDGIRKPFKRWLSSILEDFGLSSADLFAATSGGGSDVKWMMKTDFGLAWEWCVAHMFNAATKHALGLVPRQSSHNPEMTDLVAVIRLTIRLVRDVKVMGNLFSGAL